MKDYHPISIATGSAMHVVDAMLQRNPNLKVAVIDKDEPGGICLTRGCIPSKILLYPAEMVRTIERANEFGIDVQLHKINFNQVMERMRHHINEEIEIIRNGFSKSQNIDYYREVVEFIEAVNNSINNHNNVDKQKPKKTLTIQERTTGQRMMIRAEEVLIAAGRGPNTDILHPERAGIKTDEKGWIVVNEYLETSQPNIWAFGDANGTYLFKHKANYEAELVYYNAVLKKGEEKKLEKDYHAVPHAVFTYPEIAAVGLGEREALAKYGENKILFGIGRYEDTAKGIAMGLKDYFVKVIVKAGELEIIGAHIIGPYASVLIQEIINVMYTQHERTMKPILSAMHIHPALSEVVQRSVSSLMPPQQYHHLMAEHYGLSSG